MYFLYFYSLFNRLSFKFLLINSFILSAFFIYSTSDDLIGRISLFFLDSSLLSTEKPLAQYLLITLAPLAYYAVIELLFRFALIKPIILHPITSFYSLKAIDYTKVPRFMVASFGLSFLLFTLLFLTYGFNLNYLVRSASIFILFQLFFLSKILKPVYLSPMILLYFSKIAINIYHFTSFIH